MATTLKGPVSREPRPHCLPCCLGNPHARPAILALAIAGARTARQAAATVLAGAWGVGEAIGAVLGIDRVTPLLWLTEVKPVTREQLAESDALESQPKLSSRPKKPPPRERA